MTKGDGVRARHLGGALAVQLRREDFLRRSRAEHSANTGIPDSEVDPLALMHAMVRKAEAEPDYALESPDSVPRDLQDFAARGFERRNRRAEAEDKNG